MKRKQLKFWLFLLTLGVIFAACEGPAGKDGIDGANGADGLNGLDGADGNATCMSCHSSESKSNIEAQFAQSAHSVGEVAVAYAGSRQGCAECHSHQGFVQYANTGKVVGGITSPTAWECATCHGLHETMEATDYALRLKDPINPIFDETITMDLIGNSNLCANCHQSRRAEPNVSDPGETFYISSTHYGPHHGAQANVVAGVGFAEISGSMAYPDAGSSPHLVAEASCVGCHMAEFVEGNGTARPNIPAKGGHTWNPTVSPCNDCHTGGNLTDDFDYGGLQTITHGLLEELKEHLIRLNVIDGDEEHGYHPVVGTYPMIQAQAFFNWVGLEEDRSLGAHNPKYVKALLMNTIEKLEDEPTPAP